MSRRAPRGACGLKFFHLLEQLHLLPSRPARGVWIEIIKYGIKQIKYAYRASLKDTKLGSQMGTVLSRDATNFPVAEKDDKMQMGRR